MLTRIDHVLSALPSWQIRLATVALIGVLGALDHETGYEISFSVFYLVPIFLGGWYDTRRTGLTLCLVSAATWLVVDYTSGHSYSQVWIPIWNATVRLIFFIVVNNLTASLKTRLRTERLLARTEPLTRLKNALAFKEESDLLFKNAKRHKTPISLAIIDLDKFKLVNDLQGHAEGNRVLINQALK